VEAILSALEILPLEEPVDVRYANLRLALEGAGTPIGGNDTLTSAHPLALGMTLVTANERELSRAPGLDVENWLAL